MPRSVLLDESRDDRWPVGFCGIDKVRLQPTLARMLEEQRPADQGKGEYLVVGAMKSQLIADIVAGQFLTVYRTLGTLLGRSGTSVPPGDTCPVTGPRR